MTRMTKTTLLALAALTIMAPASGQHPFEKREPQPPLAEPVHPAASISEGDAWTVDFGFNQVITRQRQTADWEPDGPLRNNRLIQNATLSCKVESIDEESGVATISADFERLLIIRGDDEQQREFRWKTGDAPAGNDDPASKVFAALSTATLTAKISPTGRVRGVTGYDDVLSALESGSEQDRAMLGIFSQASFGSQLEMIWRSGDLAGVPRNVPDQWTTTRIASLGPVGSIRIEQANEIQRIEEGKIKAEGEITLTVAKPAEPAGAGAPSIELIHEDGKGKTVWNLEKGRVDSASERLDIGARWSLGEAHLGFTMRTERSLAVR